MKKAKDKVSILSSIKTKIILLVFFGIAVSTAMNLWTIIPLLSDSMSSTTQSYMKDVTLIAGSDLEREIEILGAEVVMTPEELDKAVGGISIKGMKSSYAYVVAADGTMLYHPTTEKIGQPVENAAVTELVAEIAAGNRPETDVIEYEFKGAMKYAAFYIGQDSSYILVVTADEDEAFADMNEIIDRCIKSALITVVLCIIIALVAAIFIIKPLQNAVSLVRKISDLDLREDEMQVKIAKRRDETGLMGRSIAQLRDELVEAMNSITKQSQELHEASSTLTMGASETVEVVEQVEKSMAEIAQGASSQAHETQTATENVIVMGNMIEEANEEVEKLRTNANTMRDAGNTAMDILKELNAVNQKTKEAMQIIYDQTNVTNESAMQIKAATEIIADIAEETNLLSLNASIEAARAGEQGRGFAVVAAQIQKLAEQSNESARQIETIIQSLIAESEKSVATMEEVKDVIEKQDENVQNTEKAFLNVKDGIDSSIAGISVIVDKTAQLDKARVKVVDVVQNLTAIAEENAASTQETSASAAEVGAIMSTIAENANQLNMIADKLDESVKEFTIES